MRRWGALLVVGAIVLAGVLVGIVLNWNHDRATDKACDRWFRDGEAHAREIGSDLGLVATSPMPKGCDFVPVVK